MLQPDSPQFLSVLAQALATYPDPTIRNGTRAVLLAEEACQQTHYRIPIFLDTLAAAYAEAGQFPSAIKAVQQAIEIAEAQHHDAFVRQLQERMQLYQSGISYHASFIRSAAAPEIE
jgi:sulfur relay (sulfurtransferase) complex TusBCD TusD component (DsrE family)